nr:MAG TPA: hypothetical protein [Caudoviricetes sp.]
MVKNPRRSRCFWFYNFIYKIISGIILFSASFNSSKNFIFNLLVYLYNF